MATPKSPEKGSRGFSADENVKFLITCIRNVENQKINFDNVYKELGLISKIAAVRRLERLLATQDMKIGQLFKNKVNDPESIDMANLPAEPKTSRSKPVSPTKRKKASAKKEAGKNVKDLKIEEKNDNIKNDKNNLKEEDNDDVDDSVHALESPTKKLKFDPVRESEHDWDVAGLGGLSSGETDVESDYITENPIDLPTLDEKLIHLVKKGKQKL